MIYQYVQEKSALHPFKMVHVECMIHVEDWASVVSCRYILTPTRVHPIQELLSTSEPSVYMGPAHSKLRVHMRGKE